VSGISWKQWRIETNLKTRKWKIYARLVKSHQYYKQEIEIMEGINYTENGGEMEEGANVRTQNKQTKYVEKVKDSTTDTQAMWLTFMGKMEDRMMKWDSQFEDRMMKWDSQFEDRMMKWDSEFEDRMSKRDSEFEDRMMKWDSEFEDRMTKRDSEFEDRMTKRECDFKDKMTKMENNMKENVREAVTPVTMDMHHRVDQIIESEKDQVNAISVSTHGHI
jgi:hypothetical protein